MAIEDVLTAARDTVPGCKFTACVDLEMGMLAQANPPDLYSGEETDALTSAVSTMFESSRMVQIEDLFREAAGADDPFAPYFEDALIVADGVVHVYLRAPDNPNQVICVVSDRTDTPNDVLAAARAAVALGGS